MHPLTYIVIPVHSRGEYNTVTHLNKCVESLERTTSNYNLIFVDDWCDDEGSKAIERHAAKHPSSYIVKTFKQRWFTRACNLGLRFVRSSYAVLLNSDTELGDGWLEELYSVKEEVESHYKAMNRVEEVKTGIVGSELSHEEPRRWQYITNSHTPGDPGYCTGHGWLVSMQALQEISVARGTPGWYLDEVTQKSIHIFSDNEASYAMQKLGWLTVRSFKSLINHGGGASWGHNLGRVFSLTLDQVND